LRRFGDSNQRVIQRVAVEFEEDEEDHVIPLQEVETDRTNSLMFEEEISPIMATGKVKRKQDLNGVSSLDNSQLGLLDESCLSGDQEDSGYQSRNNIQTSEAQKRRQKAFDEIRN